MELKNYFKDDQIAASIENRSIIITINNSQLINEQSKKKGYKWSTAESFASIGALICFNNLKTASVQVDSVLFNIKINNKTESYGYKLKDVSMIDSYLSTCSEFSKLVSTDRIGDAEKMLDDNIFSKMPANELSAYLKNMYDSKVVRSEILAFKIADGHSVVYMNSYYENNDGITYVFTFLNDSSNKIAGIKPPDAD